MSEQFSSSPNPYHARQAAEVGASPIEFTLEGPDAGVDRLRVAVDRNAAGENLGADVFHDDVDQAPRSTTSPVSRRILDGEAAHKLKRAVFFHERGEIRDRTFESQAFRASGLNLVVSAIVHWNTAYLDRAVTHLKREGRNIPDALLEHVSSLSWEHINLTGIYTWDTEHQMPEGFRSLRLPAPIRRAA